MTAVIDGAFTALGWGLAAGAWAFCLATYPLVVWWVYSLREAWVAFDDSLVDLRDAWLARGLEEVAA